MTDRALLEAAAKAYWGSEIDDTCSIRWLDVDSCIGYTHGDNQDHNGCDVELLWNPLTDDGDALRLAVKLDLIDEHKWKAPVTGAIYDECNGDWYAATRRAIVRAAAIVGASESVAIENKQENA